MAQRHIIDNPDVDSLDSGGSSTRHATPPLDVAVVGGGPAGAWAAYRLARQGVRVALFDGSHPREKPCGGGVTGRALGLVSGVPVIATLPRVRIDSARFEFGDRPDAIVSLGRPAGDALAVASRRAFDSALLAAAAGAGAGLIPERVLDVRVGPSGVELETATARYRAAQVLGADGATSLVRRRLATPFPRSQISIATGVFAHGLSTTEIVIRFTTNPPGYG